jgi:hypothetical protein
LDFSFIEKANTNGFPAFGGHPLKEHGIAALMEVRDQLK